MPIFEYQCAECGHVSSFLEKAGAKQKHVCEKCQSEGLTRKISTFSPAAGKSSSGHDSCPTGTCPLS